MGSVWTRLALAVAAALSLRACALETFRVSGVAMVPAVIPGDTILASKVHYGLRVPGSGSIVWGWGKIERGDVVVLGGVGEPPLTVVRRIVGLPGDILKVENGRIQRKQGGAWTVVAWEPISEGDDYFRENADGKQVLVRLPAAETAPAIPAPADPAKPAGIELGRDEVFVLADDRRDGLDSRHFGAIPIESIIGKATSIWVPATQQNREFAVDKVLPVKINQRGYFTPVL